MIDSLDDKPYAAIAGKFQSDTLFHRAFCDDDASFVMNIPAI